MTARELSAAEAAALVRPTDTMAIPLGPGAPATVLHALGERDDWEDLQVFGGLLLDLYQVFTKPGVHYRSGFFGPAERLLIDAGADIEFLPADFRRFVILAEKLAPRVVMTSAAAPDAQGHMSLSLHAGATVGELHRAAADPERIVIVEANAKMPRTVGLPPQFSHSLHVDEVDVIVPSAVAPFVLTDPPATDVERAIAELARTFVPNGATLQTGIGGIPSTVVTLLAEQAGGEYGIHSELFTTGLMLLHQAGKVTNTRKGIFNGFSVTTFALGTPELYAWLDGNADVRFLPVDIVNAPHTIGRNNNMVSINGALAIDVYGQVSADRIADRQYSGIGGHEDFVAPSGLDLEDRSLICMPSTVTRGGVTTSRIVANLPPGSTVTTPRHQVDIVITEYGSASLRGQSVRERAEALIAIAHPDFRADLAATVPRT